MLFNSENNSNMMTLKYFIHSLARAHIVDVHFTVPCCPPKSKRGTAGSAKGAF